MIHSSIVDNWHRVQTMHTVAHSLFMLTHDSDFRERKLNSGNPFPFEPLTVLNMQHESSIVSMVMAWSVIMLECLVNHAIANKINNKTITIIAIEYPQNITGKFKKLNNNLKSELSKKIAILSDEIDPNISQIKIADELSEVRNRIIHDKPFELIESQPGEVEITYFKTRGQSNCRSYVFDDLKNFYEKCEKVKDYILKLSTVDDVFLGEISFTDLIKSG